MVRAQCIYRLLMAVVITTVSAAVARSQTPVNPLRRVSEDHTALAVWDDTVPPSVAAGRLHQQVSYGEDLVQPEPKSIVPPELAPAEPLPPLAFGNLAVDGPVPQKQWPASTSAGVAPEAAILHEPGTGWFDEPWFTHGDPNDPYRHAHKGQPLIGTSWRNRPFYFGAFLGGILMDDLIAERVEANNSFFIGGRLGWDFDHYWGLEGRYAFSRPQLTDGEGENVNDPARCYFIDLSVAYYPWGDSRWRPYVGLGLGFQTYRFHDDTDERIHQSLLSVPLSIGLKYYHSPWVTMRLDACDNIALGDGQLSGMGNISLMAGVEVRFGGRRTSYFPWHANTSYW